MQANLTALFQSLSRHKLDIEAEFRQRDRQAFRKFGNYLATDRDDQKIAGEIRLVCRMNELMLLPHYEVR